MTDFDSILDNRIWVHIKDLMREGYEFEEASRIALRSKSKPQNVWLDLQNKESND